MKLLSKQRYKVISLYPTSTYWVNEIITPDKEGNYTMCTIDGFVKFDPADYPLIFKKLEWDEDRSDAEMEEFLKEIRFFCGGEDVSLQLVKAANDLFKALKAIDDHWTSGNFSRNPELWEPMKAALAKATT